ncbi:MAG: helix-turn-helix domain-containing protein [Lachnospiraceae bacterium]|nr:helix-turn-helix domain-containing protein [Lachnospiraceae bacterium]
MNSREILLKLREDTGMNRRQFAEYFGIPYRTIQDWELGNRKMPEYLLRLMVYKANMEKLVKSDSKSKK